MRISKGLVPLLLSIALTVKAQENTFHTQFIAQISRNLNARTSPLRLNIIPSKEFAYYFENSQWLLDSQIAASFTYNEDDLFAVHSQRAWLRFSGDYFEWTLGKQRISFGSTKIFHPLEWFGSSDPLNPEIADPGVSALLLRWLQGDNNDFWVWFLPESIDTSAKNSLSLQEMGLRYQFPWDNCEAAINLNTKKNTEQKIGFDASIELGLGFFAEAVYTRKELLARNFKTSLEIASGVDYTIPIGDGLYVLFEGFHDGAQRPNTTWLANQLSYPLTTENNLESQILIEQGGQERQYSILFQHSHDSISLLIYFNSYKSKSLNEHYAYDREIVINLQYFM